MPYIKKERRDDLDEDITALASKLHSPGEMNYAITRLIQASGTIDCYTDIAVITGVLENVKQEFYRRAAAPYEDSKMEENGDVYAAPV